MIQIIHLSVLVSLFNGKGTFEIHHQQQQCLQIYCRNCAFDAPLLVFKTRMMNIFFCRVTPLRALFSSQEREYPEYLLRI